MSFLVRFHGNLFYAIMLVGLIVGIWGIVLYFCKQGITQAFRSILLLFFTLALLEGALGLTLFLSGLRPHDPLHYVYGGIVVFALPVALGYSSGKNIRKDSLIFGIAALIAIAAATRAFFTGM